MRGKKLSYFLFFFFQGKREKERLRSAASSFSGGVVSSSRNSSSLKNSEIVYWCTSLFMLRVRCPFFILFFLKFRVLFGCQNRTQTKISEGIRSSFYFYFLFFSCVFQKRKGRKKKKTGALSVGLALAVLCPI